MILASNVVQAVSPGQQLACGRYAFLAGRHQPAMRLHDVAAVHAALQSSREHLKLGELGSLDLHGGGLGRRAIALELQHLASHLLQLPNAVAKQFPRSVRHTRDLFRLVRPVRAQFAKRVFQPCHHLPHIQRHQVVIRSVNV